MSASLVGSEMCIRDSGRIALARAMAWAGICTLGEAWAARFSACHASVSYTHLTLPTICSV
eukprot:4465825-Alexandrium_andersonii.AAC.1